MGFFANLGLGGTSDAEKGLRNANSTLKKAYDTTVDIYDPYRTFGNAAWRTISNANGLNGAAEQRAAAQTFRSDPGYQFKMDQGIQAIDRSAAAKGLMGSGSTLKALTEYGQGLADQSYGDWYNRVAGQADTGANTAGAQAAAKLNSAGAQGVNQAAIGATRTNGTIAGVSALTSGLSKLAGAF